MFPCVLCTETALLQLNARSVISIIMKGEVQAPFCQSEAEPAWIFIFVVGTNSPNDLQEGNK